MHGPTEPCPRCGWRHQIVVVGRAMPLSEAVADFLRSLRAAPDWQMELRATPRRTKRPFPASKPAPPRQHRRGAY